MAPRRHGKTEGENGENQSSKIRFMVGEQDDDIDTKSSETIHPLFSEMQTLKEMKDGEIKWNETGRWVKFEESVEEGASRWSKPHVPSLSMHSLLELRSAMLHGAVMLDMDAVTMEEVARQVTDHLVHFMMIPSSSQDKVFEVLLSKHKHLYEKKNKLSVNNSLGNMRSRTGSFLKSIASTTSIASSTVSASSIHGQNVDFEGNDAIPSNDDMSKGNTNFMKKIAPGSEAANILVAELDYLEKPVTAFIRLGRSAFLDNVTEVSVPTKFIFLILGPKGNLEKYQQVGRSMATLFSDAVFHEMAYRGADRDDLLAGFDDFLGIVTVLPPGVWDPQTRIEPPAILPSQEKRKLDFQNEENDQKPKKMPEEILQEEEEEEQRQRENSGLVRTGRLFGGLINDVKRKAPHYISDFKDGFAMQSLASFFFLYFACLAPIITFGGLLGDATGNNIAAMESLVSGVICGVLYGFFSGQPLTILGSTGPVLVFETILYEFCMGQEWNYLSFRMWIGLWAALILLIMVSLDASALVCYITRFTEENFACLIALIFVIKAIEKVALIGSKYPMETMVDVEKYCNCSPNEYTLDTYYELDWSNVTREQCHAINGTLTGAGCEHYYADVYLLSIVLFFGTFLISIYLKDFKTAPFFPTWIRVFISDFAVIIAILSMSITDMMLGIHTPKLEVPSEFNPTIPDRGWVVSPFGGGQNPWWTCLLAFVPALLVCILLFMDQQITAVIINRKEFKLKKGCGYHLDLFILSILIAINSIMGLPWFVAATVLAINHVNSLKKESECAAPGEKPQFLGVRENRLTNITIFLFIGLSVFMTPLLSKIPMAVLYGVFLYMGISALKGIQFFDRIMILFIPQKYQPDHSYLREVPLKKVHLFTAIQLLCLIALWVIKSFAQTSILFPLMLVIMVGVRKSLDWVFTQRELKIMDDVLPQFKRKENQDLKKDVELDSTSHISKVEQEINGIHPVLLPQASFNISTEVDKTSLWRTISGDNLKSSVPRRLSVKKNKTKTEDIEEIIPSEADSPSGIDNHGMDIEWCPIPITVTESESDVTTDTERNKTKL